MPLDSTSGGPSSVPWSGALVVVGDQGDDFERSGELPPIPRTSRVSARQSARKASATAESRVSKLRTAATAVKAVTRDLRVFEGSRKPSATSPNTSRETEARKESAIMRRGDETLISDAI